MPKILNFPGSSYFQQDGAPPQLALTCTSTLRNNYATLDWKAKADGVIGKETRFDIFGFLYVGLCENLCLFSSDTISVSNERLD